MTDHVRLVCTWRFSLPAGSGDMALTRAYMVGDGSLDLPTSTV